MRAAGRGEPRPARRRAEKQRAERQRRDRREMERELLARALHEAVPRNDPEPLPRVD